MVETHFDAVVVGSGFGGSVMAYRLAEAGSRVCLLERGRAYPPGSFPRSPYRVRENFWDPSEGLHGLFDFWSFHRIHALVASGLGGGSLIYANVLMRKDERWFVKEDLGRGGFEHWPVTRADLDPHYDAVEGMLRPQKYPFDQVPYSTTSKTRAFREAARKVGMEPFSPDLAVTFAPAEGEAPVPGEPIREERPNLHGRTRQTCRLCGECDIGCNYGSKNTLDYNYLSEAKRLGAEIRTGCEVKSMEPRASGDGGYAVRYVEHQISAGGDPGGPRTRVVTADRLVLSAGSLGSTYLLLKNRSAFPRVSKRLGTRFCGNGDYLTLAVKATEEAGGRRVPRVIDPGYGPVITSAVRGDDDLDGGEGRGFYLEDAGFRGRITRGFDLRDVNKVFPLATIPEWIAGRVFYDLLGRVATRLLLPLLAGYAAYRIVAYLLAIANEDSLSFSFWESYRTLPGVQVLFGEIAWDALLLVTVFVLFFFAIRRTAARLGSSFTQPLPAERPGGAKDPARPEGSPGEILDLLTSGRHPPMGRGILGREIAVFVSGHTHVPSLSRLSREAGDDVIVVNSGCWLRQLRPVRAHLGGPPVFVPKFTQTHARVYLDGSGVRAELWEHPRPAPHHLRAAERIAILGRLPAQPAPDSTPRVTRTEGLPPAEPPQAEG